MAALQDSDRFGVWARFMGLMGPQDRANPMSKADFRAAIDAIDAWLSDNASTINNAFPTASRQALTNVEKIGVFAYVALKRYGKGVV